MSKFLYDIKEESESSLSLESQSTQATACDPTYLISIIGDEDTCVGYLLGGIGEVDDEEQPNYFIVDQNTKDLDVELAIKRFVRRGDIGIILITKDAAEKVPNMLHAFEYNKALPMVIKIPGKNGPYDVNVDQYLRKLKEINGWLLNYVGCSFKSFAFLDNERQLTNFIENVGLVWYCQIFNSIDKSGRACGCEESVVSMHPSTLVNVTTAYWIVITQNRS
ncbi:hypothetical protein NQ317_018774 [Molorchus minor]|uniref:V-type proton ATPase subunit F n=1 Tax=Molorchus minor TaxID=1323400 RepID=A0ABQ9IQE9_9CUCU|nr:hypothetical protein NQ317_018774 [Molorchus minor]